MELLSNSRGLVALGIDAPNGTLLDAWIANGDLPVLRQLQQDGATARYRHTKQFRNERCWDLFLYGQDLGRAGSTFRPDSYGYHNDSPQRDDTLTPFYAQAAGCRVCVFDLPAPLVPGLDGLQASGWGSELNVAAPMSQPPGLMHELEQAHGADPKLSQVMRVFDPVTAAVERSYVLPNLYVPATTRDFRQRLVLAVQRRTQILLDLLRRGHWDLFLAVFVESHSANHALWHLGEAHPLADASEGHAQLDVMQAIDRAIGQVLQALPADQHAMVYTLDHTVANTMDLPSMGLLPELLYRWNFPGQVALAPGAADPAAAAATHWKHAVWACCTAAARTRLESPAQQEADGEPLSWNPANWFRPLWPDMRAFALPSVSDGYIRVNLRGREARGLVDPADFDAVLDELTALVQGLVNPHTGGAAVARVVRTRRRPEDEPHIPPDLVVCWDEQAPTDRLDSPALTRRGDDGHLGPLPYFRSGGHVAHGSPVDNVCFVRGPGIAAGSRWRDGQLIDLPVTMLDLLGRQAPPEWSGRPLSAP